MCGIAGYSHATDVTRRMLPHLLWEMESRGKDSWGATNGFDVVKHIGPVTYSFEESRAEIETWDRAIFHTRGASTGDITVENQHPFTFSNAPEGSPEWRRTVIGIHNGIVANHNTLNDKYSRNFTCDSMHIYKHLADGLEMREIRGWGNLAWYDFTPSKLNGVLRLLRFNQDALEIAKLKTGEHVFCSTAAPIVRAARMAGSCVDFFYKVQPETIYTIEWNVDKVEMFSSKKKLVFGSRYEPVVGFQHSHQQHQHQHQPFHSTTSWESNRTSNGSTLAQKQYQEGMCVRMGCTKIVVGGSRRNAVLCEECFKTTVMDAMRESDQTRLNIVNIHTVS